MFGDRSNKEERNRGYSVMKKKHENGEVTDGKEQNTDPFILDLFDLVLKMLLYCTCSPAPLE